MPELSTGAEYLVAFLHSAGTASSTGMGLTGLSWQELEAWASCTDNVGIVTARDLKTVHTLSRVYANECAKATQKGAKAPYEKKEPVTQEVREVVSNKADDLFGGMIRAQKAVTK